MMENIEEQGDRLRQARERRGFKTARAACVYFGWKYDTYIQHERSERGISQAAARYATAYQVSEGWLLTGEGSIDPVSTGIMVPLVSWISAGKLQDASSVEDTAGCKMINAGDLPKGGKWLALEVQGDSMDRLSPPGAVIVIDRNDRDLVSGACYVIREDDGAATYKRYRADPDRFEPVSSNSSHETLFPKQAITIIGRVRKTILEM